MRIGGVDFPEPLLNALRDGRLVVFAGAGVSMGPPARLPDFSELARQIAEGTGLAIGESEPEDRFLGRLKATGPDVHQIAAQRLLRNEPQPTELHRNLLRLYSRAENVRIVTTNFDLLFEEAADSLFNPKPKVFHAPVLPLGGRFQGIVLMHGSVNEPGEMVLTNLDFGRAYLTEADGWARRFLVDLFVRHTVLFVGYSHNDTIMTYLTPSLPRDGTGLRYALIGECSDVPERWRNMGITPFTFHQSDKNDYARLYKAVEGLATHRRRGILGWQLEITGIASAPPPIDEESAGVIDHALSSPELTQFFTGAAVSPDWIGWLDRRRHLDALFADGQLSEPEGMLAAWLSRCFALAHDGALFQTMGGHGFCLNPEFWKLLSWRMQNSISDCPDAAVMARWVHFLATAAPRNSDITALSWIAKAAASVGATDALLRTYEEMTDLVHRELPVSGGLSSGKYHHELKTITTECLKLNLDQVAEPLLEITARRLSERHSALAAWCLSESDRDPDSIFRSAIEPHPQDRFGYDIDALIDAARECLDWLAANRTEYARLWAERQANSPAPLLRRLAIHTLTKFGGLSADEKIAWLLERCDIIDLAAKRVLFKTAGQAYPFAGQELRGAFIQAVLDFRLPDSEDYDSEALSAGRHFQWLRWLHESAPDCEMTMKALDGIREQHPQFLPSEGHSPLTPAVTSWSGAKSPWTVEALLATPAAEILPSLLDYQPTDREFFGGYHRSAVLDAIQEAVKQNPDWGIDLADSLAGSSEWGSDLWPSILRAWAETEMAGSRLQRALSYLSVEELHKEHAHDIASALCELSQSTNSAKDGRFLPKANAIAAALRLPAARTGIPSVTRLVGGVPQEADWLNTAIDHPSGKLAEFWLRSIDLWRNGQETPPQSLSSEYRSALNGIMQESGISGKLGRAILASHFHYLMHADEVWARDNLLPLFDSEHEDFRAAWDGFLTRGRITPQVADDLREPFLKALQRAKQERDWGMRHHFFNRYADMLVQFVSGPGDEWITQLFGDSDGEVRSLFAARMAFILRSLNEEEQREWWTTWLRGYWENRLQGVPRPLDDAEVAWMLEWVIPLTGVFPEAVTLAGQMPKVPIERSIMLHRISESKLIDEQPGGLAKFLIHLGQCDTQPWFWHGTGGAVDRLLAKDLLPDVETGLRELAAKKGQWMGG